MQQYVNEFRDKFTKLKEIEEKYGLNVQDVTDILAGIDDFQVTSPVIGNFSTGKSSLLNAVLGKQMLSVDITPETAVPTEICYGPENSVKQIFGDSVKEYQMEDLPIKGLNIRNTDLVRIRYSNEFLKKIPNVKIVDLPGFDTSIELHNMAIDQYLPNSLAYLLVVSSDEPVLKNGIADFLKELKLHQVPVYLIITKCNRLSAEDREACRKLLVENICNLLEVDDIPCACTESVGEEVNIDEVRGFLTEIQEKSSDIFRRKYTELLKRNAKYAEVYLMDRIDKKDLSTSELEQEQENLEKKINELVGKVEKEKKNFDAQTEECIRVMRERVQKDLEAVKEPIAVMIRNGSDVSGRVNGIIRNAVALSVKSEFEPKLQEYLDQISDMVRFEMPDTEEFNFKTGKAFDDGIVQSLFTKVAPVVLATVGALIAGPIVAIVGGALGAFADVALNVNGEKKKERKARKAADDLIAKIHVEASDSAAREIRRYVEKINGEIQEKINRQKIILEKSLEDVKMELDLEEEAKEREIHALEADLDLIRAYMMKAD
ncbi:MAG: dynamin family protein [Clostridiales bacterium]|nr:dynamin family protein [Clostridiales bacterium]